MQNGAKIIAWFTTGMVAGSTTTHVQRVRILYKTIMKVHRGLPLPAKAMGDLYVKDEFKRHKQCNTSEAALFMREWTNYAVTLAKQLGIKGMKSGAPVGVPLTEEKLEFFREEQIMQLYELMEEAVKTKDFSGLTVEDEEPLPAK